MSYKSSESFIRKVFHLMDTRMSCGYLHVLGMDAKSEEWPGELASLFNESLFVEEINDAGV